MKKTALIVLAVLAPVAVIFGWALVQEERDYRAISTLVKDGYRRLLHR